MLKSEAESAVRRVLEETGAQFTEEQIQALAQMITKIADRTVEEAFAAARSSNPGSKAGFFGS